MITPEQFVALQQYLVDAFWPFIAAWLVFFLAGLIICAVLIIFLVVSRELMTRVT